MPVKTLRIGSRGSALALAQTHWVRDRIARLYPDIEVAVRIIKTSADRQPQMSLRTGTSIGVWVKELEDALLAGEVEIAVHSMKDLPTVIPDGLEIGAVPEREDARDALVAAPGINSLADLPPACVVGAGSIRRRSQILALRPDFHLQDIRGNVDTRLQKLDRGDYDAIVIACAGMNRLGLEGRITCALEFCDMLPAPGQGALAVQVRRKDEWISALLGGIHHAPSATAVRAERTFLRLLGGGCNSPVGVHASFDGGALSIAGLIAAPDGTQVIRERVRKDSGVADDAAAELVEALLHKGGDALLRSVGRL